MVTRHSRLSHVERNRRCSAQSRWVILLVAPLSGSGLPKVVGAEIPNKVDIDSWRHEGLLRPRNGHQGVRKGVEGAGNSHRFERIIHESKYTNDIILTRFTANFPEEVVEGKYK